MTDRLSALDSAFLDLDTAEAPLHVGWTMRVEGRTPGLAALRRHLDGRLHRVPRFRQRVAAPELGGGERVWVDDPAFDVARHVHAVALAAPGGPGELRALAGTLLSTPLEPLRPLWRVYLVDGLAGDGFALVGQAHHALVDGMAALQVAALLFDAEAQPPGEAAPPPWRPAAPTPVRTAARLAGGGVRRVTQAAAKASPPTALRDTAGALDAILRPAPATALDRSVGPGRVVAFAEAGLDAVREAGRLRSATINDVLLTAASLALGRALRRRGDRPTALKALVPVDVRAGHAAALGNAISFVFVDLPVAERDPGRALAAVREQTVAAKAGGHAAPLAALAGAAELLPAAGRRAVARLATHASPFNVVVSNVAGPSAPLYLLGRRVQVIFPAVPFLRGHAVTIGALSYRERIGIGVYADAAVVPDAVEVARDLETALDVLRVAPVDAAQPQPTTPWARRARARRTAAGQRAAIR